MSALIDHRRDMNDYLTDTIYKNLEGVVEDQGLFDFNVVTTETGVIEATYIPVPNVKPIILKDIITPKGATFYEAIQNI